MMDQYLAEFYGTNKTAGAQDSGGDLEQQAQVAMFTKVAAEQNIDLNAMTDDAVGQLFNNYVSNFSKTAGDDDDDDDDDVKKKAKEELHEKKAQSEKFAEADRMGRVMAHAYVQEMRKIAGETGSSGDDNWNKEAGRLSDAVNAVKEFGKKVIKGKEKIPKQLAQEAGKANPNTKGAPLKVTLEKFRSKPRQWMADHPEATKGIALGAAGTAGVGAAVGAQEAHRKYKEASALDELALEQAVIKSAEAGFDPSECADRLNAARTLGSLDESIKVAGITDLGTAVEVRALELLESVGYPINWA